jgi:two-component system NtrC family sensor kinase
MPTTLLLATDDPDFADGWSPAPRQEGSDRGDRPPKRVLVAEDDPLVRGMLERMLVELGYEVRTARHGAEALDLAIASEVPFDLVITDVRMPRVGGPELGRRLEQRWPGLPILYISGYDIEGPAGADASHRRSAFLRKPFDPDELARRVARLLGEA